MSRTSAAESPANVASLRAGTNFITTRVYSPEEDERILNGFEGLRVADVSDGMDAVGLHNTGLMDPEIRPLWPDTDIRHAAPASASGRNLARGSRRDELAVPRKPITAWPQVG
jgi:hypothetical protein